MNRINFLSLIALVSTSLCSGQQKIWSLQQCVDIALQNNLDIQVQQLEVAKAKKIYYHPLFQMLPSVSASANHSYNFGSTIDPATNNRVSSDIQWDNFYLNAQMNLLDFNVLATERKNKIDIQKAKANKEIVEYEYKLQLLEKYYEVLYAQRLTAIQKEQLQNTVYNLNRIKKEVALGKKPKSDLYDIQLSCSQDKIKTLEAQQMFDTMKMQLFQLMNYMPEDIKDIALIPAHEEDNEAETLITNNPRISWAEWSEKSAFKNIAVQKAVILPSITAFYSFSSFYSEPLNQPNVAVNDFWTQLDNNKNHQVGVRLSIPVFTGLKDSRQVKVSKIEADESRLVTEQEKLKIQQQLEQEQEKKKQYESLTDKLADALFYAKESFRTTESKFVNGKIDAVIFTSVKNQLLQSEYDFLKNQLLIQFTCLKINLLSRNELW